MLGYYSPLLAWHLTHGYAAHAVAASVSGLTKSRSSGLAKSGERAETHWHVAGANATVEDVRAVLERHGARMEDPAVVMSSDGSMSCLLYTSPSPRDKRQSRMPSSA